MSWETKQQKCKGCRYWSAIVAGPAGDCYRNVVIQARYGGCPACQWWDRNPDLIKPRKRKVTK